MASELVIDPAAFAWRMARCFAVPTGLGTAVAAVPALREQSVQFHAAISMMGTLLAIGLAWLEFETEADKACIKISVRPIEDLGSRQNHRCVRKSLWIFAGSMFGLSLLAVAGVSCLSDAQRFSTDQLLQGVVDGYCRWSGVMSATTYLTIAACRQVSVRMLCAARQVPADASLEHQAPRLFGIAKSAQGAVLALAAVGLVTGSPVPQWPTWTNATLLLVSNVAYLFVYVHYLTAAVAGLRPRFPRVVPKSA